MWWGKFVDISRRRSSFDRGHTRNTFVSARSSRRTLMGAFVPICAFFRGGGVFRLQFCVQTGISCEMSGLGVADLK